MDKREYIIDKTEVKKLGIKGALGFSILAGFWMIVIGAGLSFTVILAIIGVPLIISGLLAPIIGPIIYKNAYRIRCRACNAWLLLMKSNKYTKACRKCKAINKLSI